MTTFAGWVPTITGQLSFSLIGLRAGSSGCITANAENVFSPSNPPHRTVLVIQKRVTRDLPFLIRIFHRARIKNYILTGETRGARRPVINGIKVTSHHDEIGVLCGNIFIVPFHRDRLQRKWAERLVLEIRNEISSFRSKNIVALRTNIEAKIKYARSIGISIIDAEYELYRTGEIRLVVSQGNPDSLAEQIYYFIKDSSHRHYHHSRSTDNLLPLTRATKADDATWRRNTLWSLTRSVLEARRRDKLEGYKSALGILAYADAFQGLLAKTHRNHSNSTSFDRLLDQATYDFAHTRASLDAKIGEHEYNVSATNQSIALWITSLLATAALWIAAVQIRDPTCNALGEKIGECSVKIPPYIARIISFIIEKPHWGYAALLIIALLYVGRKILILPSLYNINNAAESWGQALGASASRNINSRLPTIGDKIGSYIASASIIILGITSSYAIWQFTKLFISFVNRF